VRRPVSLTDYITAFPTFFSAALVGTIALVGSVQQAQTNINISQPAYAPRVVVVGTSLSTNSLHHPKGQEVRTVYRYRLARRQHSTKWCVTGRVGQTCMNKARYLKPAV
jgi:hypothetical protein